MISTIADILAIVFLLMGTFFMFVGSLGVVRLPDTYNRLHAASKCATIGLVGLLLATVFHVVSWHVVLVSIITIVFAFVALPVGAHILGKAVLHDRVPLWDKTLSNEHIEEALEDDSESRQIETRQGTNGDPL